MTAVAALSTVTARGDTVGVPEGSAPTETAGSAAPLDEGRFRVLLDNTADLLERIQAVETDTAPTGPEEANRMLGIDDASPLRFAALV